MLDEVVSHCYATATEMEEASFQSASSLYIDLSGFANDLTQETGTGDFLTISPSLGVIYSALFILCRRYSRLGEGQEDSVLLLSETASAMRAQALDGIRTVSSSVVDFSVNLETTTSTAESLGRVGPMIMDCLYAAATHFAGLIREDGDAEGGQALDSLRQCLKKLGTQWRNAKEYLRILEAQEVSTYFHVRDMLNETSQGSETEFPPVHAYGRWKMTRRGCVTQDVAAHILHET